MSPTYETAIDQQNEARVVDFLKSVFPGEYKKAPKHEVYDYQVCRDGHGYAILEIKVRFKQIDPYYISVRKLNDGISLSRSTGIPYFLIVWFPDGTIRSRQIKAGEAMTVTWWGRTDRGNESGADEELVALFPINSFKILGSVPRE